jgi:nucleotide-binding universal stress UspA family protein
VFDQMVVALDGSAEAEAAGRVGLRVASALGSEVTAISVIDVRVVEGPAVETLAPLWGEVTGRPFQPEVMRIYRERAHAALTGFGREAEAMGVRLVRRVADIGVAEDALLDLSREADLLVMGRRGEHAGFGRQSVGATLWRVLHRASCPVLVGAAVEVDERPEAAVVRPLVAWDCSTGGRAALKLAIRYASSLDLPLHLVHAGDESADAELDRAHKILAETGITWESARLQLTPSAAVAEAAERWQVDGLFMGAFGRGRLRDFLFGSHTAEILDAFHGPVFVTC